MIRMLATLAALGALCGTLLVATAALTAPSIEENRRLHALALLASLVDTLPADTPLEDAVGACDDWRAYRYPVSGYAGPIRLLAVWRPEGTVSLRVTGHQETPGIGDFIDHARSDWLPALDRSDRETFATLDAVSGATVTSKAIVAAADAAFERAERDGG